MKRYAARVHTIGFLEGEVEGPFYRYFYEKSMKPAYEKLRREYREMFNNGLIVEFFGSSHSVIVDLDIKPVGGKVWYNIYEFIRLDSVRRAPDIDI